MDSRGTKPSIGQKTFLIARYIVHPYLATAIIGIYAFWLFSSWGTATFNLYASASLEWTKALFAVVALSGSVRLARIEKISGWKIAAIAFLFLGIGEVVYGFGIIASAKPDFPVPMADNFFLIAIPLGIFGFFKIGMHGLNTSEKIRIALDGLALTATATYISISLMINYSETIRKAFETGLAKQLSFAVLDIFFACLAFSLLLYRRYDKMIIPIAIGMMLQSSGDIMWITDQFRGSMDTRPYGRLVLLIASALYCFAATRDYGRPTQSINELSDKRLRIGIFTILFSSLVFASVSLMLANTISQTIAASFIALFLVTLLSQGASHFENYRLTRRQRQSLETLSRSEERFRVVFENGPTGLVLLDTHGTIIKANIAFSDMVSAESGDLVGTELIWLIHPEDRENHFRNSNSIFDHISTADYEARFMGKDGSISWGSISVCELPSKDKESYVIYQIEDITKRKRSEEHLEYLTIHDPLTGLANRTYIVERITEALHISKINHHSLGILFIDLDRFKVINDSLGHTIGDNVLKTISHRIRSIVGQRGTVARFGGDEFVVLIAPPTTQDTIHILAQEILNSVIEPFTLDESETYISCSIGAIISDGQNENPQSLLRDADSAMFRAKELGRNRIETADKQSHKKVMKELKTVSELHRAVANNEMRVFYQPIVQLDTDEIAGFEALVRWIHPEKGLISPDNFIPLAEETGLILDIGRYVAQEAFSQLSTWQQYYCLADGSELSMSVNLAVRQMSDPKLIPMLDEILTNTPLAQNSTYLEITESALLGDTRHAIKILNEIHDLGYKLRIDDFGTGYSSLSYLKRFPINGFKIDKSFVDGLDKNEDDTAIVHALIGLAHSMRLSVVAEGVETSAEENSLKSLGCGFGQGYLYSRPQPASEFSLPHNRHNIQASDSKKIVRTNETGTDISKTSNSKYST